MKKKLIEPTFNNNLEDLISLRVEAMGMVYKEYGNTLSHEEFMDKTEELFVMLLEGDLPIKA